MDEWTCGWTSKWTSRRMSERVRKWTSGRVDGRVSKWTSGRTNKYTGRGVTEVRAHRRPSYAYDHHT